MSHQYPSLANFNWRREFLVLALAAMEVTWLSGWIKIILGAEQSAGLATVWLSTFGLYLIAITTARALVRRPTPRIDWIIGSLALISTLLFLNLNLYPTVRLFDLRWPAMLIQNVISGVQGWPREITGLFIGFFIWFRGLRLPRRRRVSIRTAWRHVQIGLAMVIGLALAAVRFPINSAGIIVTYFATSLLVLALTRIEEAARTEAGVASPFGRKWLMTLLGALFFVGVIALIAANVLTVDALRTLLRPLVLVAEAILSAMLVLAGLLAQYVLFPIIIALINRLFPEGLNLQALEEFQQQQEATQGSQAEGGELALLSAEVLNALRVIGITLVVLIVLWLVVRSFRRWRHARETASGVRDAAEPTTGLADDLLDYLRDQWQRLRQAADVRRLLRIRGAGSVRAIYASLLALMAAADHPREAGQTPYEFEPTVEQTLPMHRTEIQAITEAYVQARYGEQDVSDQELRRLRDAWRRVEADGVRLIQEK